MFKRLVLAALAAASACTAGFAQPGRLISVKPLANPDVPANARAWLIRYETTDAKGARTESTAALFAPRAAGRNRPVVAWAHGTVGIEPKCQLSALPNGLKQIPDIAGQVARGWAVVATDYPGLGTPGPHAYLVGDAAARAVLDSVRAARMVPRAGAGGRFAAWGHSQGGHSVLWTAKRASYAPELTLVGVAAASPPTDLQANFEAADPIARGMLSAYIVRSWNRVYGAPMETVASRRTIGIINRATAGCIGQKAPLAQVVRLFALRGRLGRVDFGAVEPWAGLVRANSVAAAPLGAPAWVGTSAGDRLVGDRVTRAWAASACAAGANVTLAAIAEPDHNLTASASAPEAMRWIADRFAGRPAAGCSGVQAGNADRLQHR